MFWKRFKRDRAAILGLIIVIVVLFIAIFAPIIAHYDPYEQSLLKRRQLPNKENIFGRDAYGRDIFTRILYGARTTVTSGFFVVLISIIGGTALGVIAGYWGGIIDNFIMRGMDFLLALPYFFLAILIVAFLGPGLFNAIIAVIISLIPQYARVLRGATLGIKKSQFVEAAKAIGASDFRIIIEHIIPNLIGTVIVLATVGIATSVIGVASLSFLGMGAQSPTAEWGLMLSEGREYITSYPHMIVFPGIFLAIFVLGINLVGDGLRDVLDPRLK
jgi:ABC-type dipeptide/oligopeptide/nickel transport system permease subunit